jgi:hypothetical protein
MARQLVFVHGRSYAHPDAAALKTQWLETLAEGLAKSGLTLPIADSDVRMPYYGATLAQVLESSDAPTSAAPIVERAVADETRQTFFAEVLDELRSREGIDMARLEAIGGPAVLERGPLSAAWLEGILAAIDASVPGTNAARIAQAVDDEYCYLHETAFRQAINDDVRRAIALGRPTVVVGHSLGALIAYQLLCDDPRANQWVIPLFVTLGAPLGLSAIRKRLNSVAHPPCVGHWLNAIDPRDTVALHPLTVDRFDVEPPVDNKVDIDNDTVNRHGIEGYLADAGVAAQIHAALVG